MAHQSADGTSHCSEGHRARHEKDYTSPALQLVYFVHKDVEYGDQDLGHDFFLSLHFGWPGGRRGLQVTVRGRMRKIAFIVRSRLERAPIESVSPGLEFLGLDCPEDSRVYCELEGSGLPRLSSFGKLKLRRFPPEDNRVVRSSAALPEEVFLAFFECPQRPSVVGDDRGNHRRENNDNASEPHGIPCPPFSVQVEC